MKKYSLNIAIAGVLMAVIAAGCDTAVYRKASGETWGTFYNITYKASSDLHDSIKVVMAEVDNSLSAFNKGSLVSRINRNEADEPDALFRTVFDKSVEVSRLSGGRFDPTVMPLVNLWGFGYADGNGALPADEEVVAALATVGIADCLIKDGKIVKKDGATEFDFSAIAKGYGCDLVGRMLERNGCENYMVEIGGEMTLKGLNDRGEKWRIMVDAPIENNEEVVHERAALISVTDCGIASSGNYRRYRETEGRKVGHTISPLTGEPVQTELLAVTVIAPDAITADALATACMAMPLAEAKAMIENLDGVEALFITAGDPFTITTTSSFPELQ